jgi:leucyl-tRNA synthetase
MSTERRRPFPFHQFEPQWQSVWESQKSFRSLGPGDAGFDASKPKFYALDMFPYPSGEGLHVGHPEGYTATDIVSRFKKKSGFNVLHPMGWDAFGLPAEQYAIKTGQHPRATTEKNVANFRKQLKALGFGYDWDREVNTTDPAYFKWTQWIFLQIYNSWFNPATQQAEPISTYTGNDADSVRLAYVHEAPVNWCPELGTVLSNEEVTDGKSEVGGFPVERRPMKQWMLRITAFADRLAAELEPLDWPEGIKARQRDWIGRSEGAEVSFVIDEQRSVTVFTTRPDTLFGATYMVLAPEHGLVSEIATAKQMEAVVAYQKATAGKSDMDRGLAKEKSGVWTGATAVNPVNGQRIPIWISDYVMMGYGTGAIMAVPAHDERDFEFATKFQLEIKHVVVPRGELVVSDELIGKSYVSEGVAINSGFLDGMGTQEAKSTMIAWLVEKGLGKKTVNYKLRDWLFARQRYWGEPFPIVWEGGKHRALAESELPVLPPELVDFKPTGTVDPPLSKATEWVAYSATARRELNTMPQWAGSCWYYLRYCDARNADRFISHEAEAYWMGKNGTPGGVDLYVGGTEHAVLHLLYSRFWHKILFDLGHLTTNEPFQKLVNQGLIMGEDGRKMSKSLGNVVNPDHVINEYGADSLRLYEMFMGPLEQVKPWSMKGVEGVHRFLARVWRLVMEEDQEGKFTFSNKVQDVEPSAKINRLVNETIKKVGEDIERMSFNTGISAMMVCTNGLVEAAVKPVRSIVSLLHILSPYAPHLAEELFAQMRQRFPSYGQGTENGALLSHLPWPQYDEAALVVSEMEVVVQVNGKLRDRITLAVGADQATHESAALAAEKVQEMIAGKEVVKIVVVPGRLVNVVVKG